MDIVDAFIIEEKSKVNWLNKFFKNYPVFYFAHEIEDIELKNKNINEPFLIKPSKSRRFIALIFILFGLYFWFVLLAMIFDKTLLPISVIFLLLLTAWIGITIWFVFFNPKISYKIILDKEKIKIGKQTFLWNEVSSYLLMEKGRGRHLESTLVLFIHNNIAKKYNINNMNKSGDEIIKRIEFYEKNNVL